MQVFVNFPPQTGTAPCVWPFKQLKVENIAAEPSLNSSSVLGVYEKGGPLAQAALNHIRTYYKNDIARAEKEGLSAVVDCRVHRLMPGMFPAVPGWHCDGVPRNSYHGQPQFDLINNAAFHVCVSLSDQMAGVSNTQFVCDPIRAKLWDQEHIYRDLHNVVQALSPSIATINDGVFVKYTPKTIHRAAATHRRGWRWWMRFSMYHKPPITDKVDGLQQVYILSEENGW